MSCVPPRVIAPRPASLLAAVWLSACADEHVQHAPVEQIPDATASVDAPTRDASVSDAATPWFVVDGGYAWMFPPPEPAPPPGDPNSCGYIGARAAEEVYKIDGRADRACARDADCVLERVSVSCGPECVRAAYTPLGVESARRGVAALEAERCDMFHARGCVPQPLHECLPNQAAPRCIFGQCTAAESVCPKGCNAASPGDVCRGPADCDGCPSVSEGMEGQPCNRPRLSCTQDRWCPTTIHCETQPDGVSRWVSYILLC